VDDGQPRVLVKVEHPPADPHDDLLPQPQPSSCCRAGSTSSIY
jgi:hypothetical protein